MFNLIIKIMTNWTSKVTSISMVVIAIVCCIGLGYTLSKPNLRKLNNIYSEYELDYLHTKSEIVDEVQNYITSYAPGSDLSALHLVNYCDQYDVDIKFVLAQGLQESHFGTKGLAAKTNSVWNVHAYDGLSYDQISKKGKFTHPNESIEPYLKLLKDKYLVDKTELQLLDTFINKDGNRYASYKYYEQELKKKYEKLSNSRLDSLLVIYHKQKLILKR